MNDTGKLRCTDLEQQEHSALWYRQQLTNMRMMNLLYHAAAEIDSAVLKYFSVNGFHPENRTLQLLLFSASVSRGQHTMYERLGSYALIGEVAQEVFSGVCEYRASEMDGRFTMLLIGPESIAGAGSAIADRCRRTAERCLDEYGIRVVIYVSESFSDIHSTTAIYNRLLNTVSYHRYIEHTPDCPVCGSAVVPASAAAARLTVLMDRVRALAGAVVSGEDCHRKADEAIGDFLLPQANSVEALHRLFGDYFELLCIDLSRMGIHVHTEQLRLELLALCDSATSWQSISTWFHQALDDIRRDYGDTDHAVSTQYGAAIEYIRKNLSRAELTSVDCAAAAGCSISALGRLFRSQMNISVSQYIRQERLDLAMSLLQEGRSIRETYTAAGFGSAESFHRIFKHRYGITPGQVRSTGGPAYQKNGFLTASQAHTS